ncbi:hypothetical protein A8135_10495 [Legionella jamestowniensis]|uniref:Uncharacterized protein n=1 Tax=Legionella jamestowniensis TaxID=455 RepID=A0ABX2XWY8_9GAMM|nr:hypothetical protein [Legionella jamestowniensis]OCH98726.1 hypothetical protein A8135_10495 [Legionella jamestowniensis]
MLQIDTEALISQVAEEIKVLYEKSDNRLKLPNAKELMMMQLFDKPDYLECLESEQSKESEIKDSHETSRAHFI